MRHSRLIPAAIGALVGTAVIIAVGLWLRPMDSPGTGSTPASDSADGGVPAVPWAFFSQLPVDGPPGAFVVQAGFFGEDRPRVDLEVPWAVDTAVELARMPAVARPAAGAIVYVADDGVTSTIHRVAIDPEAVPEVVGEVDDAVWSVAVTPDGSAAYLAIVTRGRPDADRGVVRVALDGSGTVEPFLEPVATAPSTGFRLAAIAPFTVTLDISADGRYLARTACRGGAGCETSLVDVATGADHDVAPGMTLVDVGTDGVVVVEDCGQLGCVTKAMDVESGASVELRSMAFDTAVASVGGRAIIVGIEVDPGGGAVLVASDPRNGARRELHRVPEGQWMSLGSRSHLMPVVDGAVLAVEMTEDGKAMQTRYILLPIEGGASLELPPPPIRPIGPVGLNG